MKELVLCIVFVFLVGCGRGGTPSHESCLVVDQCTGAVGSWCEEVRREARFEPNTDFHGYSCAILREDWHYKDDCDPKNPIHMCSGGWGDSPPYPCCQTEQGPGLDATL